MVCKKCGNPLNEGAVFCPKCGTKIDAASSIRTQEKNENSTNTLEPKKSDLINNSLQETSVTKKKPGKDHKALKIVGLVFAVLLVCFTAFAVWNISMSNNDANKDVEVAGNDTQTTTDTTQNDKAAGNDTESITNPSEETSPTESVPSNSGEQPYGKGTTILVYIVGSNLESNGGNATKDIDEMMNAQFGEDIHLIIQTGGAKAWQSSSVDGTSIESRYIQRYRVRSGEKELIDNLEPANMGNAQALSDFLKWGVDTYPAERYIAILWNHGGGTIDGYGLDEVYNNSGMSLLDIKTAFENTGYHFDMIGFDACLMATFETAYALSGCADYLLASEETEWANGWYYTDWLTSLGSNTNMSIEDIGKNVIDDYAASIDYVNRVYETEHIYTLSLMDLTQIDEIYSVVTDCFDEANRRITAGEFNALSLARANAAYYGGRDVGAPDGYCEQIDMMDFFIKADLMTDSQSDIVGGKNGLVVYEKNNYPGSNGIAMYFPYLYAFYEYSGSYNNAAKLLKSIGYKDSYFKFFDSFMGVIADINDIDFTPQYSGDSAETDVQTAISNNSYTEPVLDKNGYLPVVKDENGYYMIDLSVQPDEFVNNITSIWSYTYIVRDGELSLIMATPGTNEVGNGGYIAYGGLSLRPYPYVHKIAGTYTSLYYLSDYAGMGQQPETYYATARVNGEEAAIILDSHITMVPVPATGGVAPSTKVWKLRGYTTSFNEGIPDTRSLRDFKVGDKVSSIIDSTESISADEVTIDTLEYTIDSEEYSLYDLLDYVMWSPAYYQSYVINRVTDTYGNVYDAHAVYLQSED